MDIHIQEGAKLKSSIFPIIKRSEINLPIKEKSLPKRIRLLEHQVQRLHVTHQRSQSLTLKQNLAVELNREQDNQLHLDSSIKVSNRQVACAEIQIY